MPTPHCQNPTFRAFKSISFELTSGLGPTRTMPMGSENQKGLRNFAGLSLRIEVSPDGGFTLIDGT
jgi:hypothetical protein